MTEPSPPRGLFAGTLVLTPAGPVRVEEIAPGTLVLAVSGGSAPFQRVVAVRRAPWRGPAIRIRAGALADGAPQEDLLLPPGHGLLLDGALVAAGELTDGHGILHEPMDGPAEVVGLVLAAHDAVLAEGAAVETAAPEPGARPFAPRRTPDGPLRAMLAWRAEALGWAAPAAAPEAAAEVGTLRDRLTASALGPVAPPFRGPG